LPDDRPRIAKHNLRAHSVMADMATLRAGIIFINEANKRFEKGLVI